MVPGLPSHTRFSLYCTCSTPCSTASPPSARFAASTCSPSASVRRRPENPYRWLSPRVLPTDESRRGLQVDSAAAGRGGRRHRPLGGDVEHGALPEERAAFTARRVCRAL